MSAREIEAIEKRLDPRFVMLEWGSGGSTLHFAPRVARLHSIENDKAWYDNVKAALLERKVRNVNLTYVKPNAPRTKPSQYAQFKDYIEQAALLGVPRFDAVLIDGRCRPECAKFILPFIDRDSVVFIHDFFQSGRPHYKAVLEDYDAVESLKAAQSLVVLRKKA